MTDLPSISSIDDREEQLAVLVDYALQKMHAGERPDIAVLTRECPGLAGELRELLATAELAEEFVSNDVTKSVIATTYEFSDPPSSIGDYELLEELGRGGMGVVYKARQKKLDRSVALKMMLGGSAATEQDQQRFRQEAEAVAKLDHPNIVAVHEVGETNGQLYFSMKYVSGQTLAQRLQQGPIPVKEAIRMMTELCDAISEAHKHGIVHRDLKPSNILLDEHDHPYITDFGLAKQLESKNLTLTETGAILGTPGYLSPEQASAGRQNVSKPSDIYSLGALLYAMLTGAPPFEGATPVQTIMKVLEQDPIPPRQINAEIDPDLQLIVMKCLQKPQELRYHSVEALRNDLLAWQNHDPISARSSRFRDIMNRAFRESPNAVILENWGLLWMWHSLVLVILCVVTNLMQFRGIEERLPYVLLWTLGVGIWAACFWTLRRRAGPITFVERQIAHVWAGSMVASTMLFAVERILDMRVLSLSPVLGLISGMVFLIKAGMLSGQFYVEAAALFLVGLVMAWLQTTQLPQVGIILFGLVSGACFFFPGWQYHKQRVRRQL
ncbi:MAG: serine/threonine protein kinase [Planctomycetaceae bacterium]|nr:serine/threonine protein kinase [Planctomycetaceae bacterium]